MREIKYYIANDGKEFDDKEECIEYEKRFSSILDKIFFIQDKEVLTPTIENLGYCCEWCTAIYVPREEDIEIISQMFDSFSIEDPFKNYHRSGLYYYDECWRCLDEEIEKLENQKEFFMNLIGMG